MSFSAVVSDELEKTLAVLKRKEKNFFISVSKKMYRIACSDETAVNHFKNLKGNMSNLKRVHIGSFVLIFRITGDAIVFESFRHHDKSYM